MKLDFRLLDKISDNHDWAADDVGIKVVDWKYFTDKTKLILTAKSQLNELLNTFGINQKNVSRIKILSIHIFGVHAVIC